ncbi:MAG: alkane 1-monooxygenase [Cereibacter sphaeroides]|uniref:Alkane 1-monooxygenase n=1 Tax=Cereibacter sphaeroides TaxID=1063 RepID=A0A2W5SDN9_CERSP|nr:MAG: alkane 1-monooxygenase [Cereibacter sphaeroides]
MPLHPALLRFATSSLTPAPLLILGAAFGGVWIWAALIYITVFAALMDRLALPAAAKADMDAEFPAGDGLLIALAIAHMVLLPLGVLSVAGEAAPKGAERIAAFIAFGLCFGQITNPVAHELIHRGNAWLNRLGVLLYITLLFGHHASAHRHVHHLHVGTARDPNSARRGQSFYAFAPRAWIGSFRAGLTAENARPRHGIHPYAIYLGGAAICCLLALLVAGWPGLFAYLGLALYATNLLLLSDYVQHYGLTRALRPDGRPERIGPQHSWNASQPFSAAMMLNAPRHSDHHAHPSRPYAALALPPQAPRLPRSLPVMATAALIPPLWRRIMHPRLDRLAQSSRESDGAGAGALGTDLAILPHG